MKIGENIRYYRKLVGLTQGQLAEKVGLKQYILTKYENGVHSPKPEMIELIANSLGIEIQLLFGSSTPESSFQTPKKSSRTGQMLEAFEKLDVGDQRSLLKQAKALALTKASNSDD